MGVMDDPVLRARIERTIERHRRTLNRFETHLGCVTCRGPLTDGVCPACDPEPVAV